MDFTSLIVLAVVGGTTNALPLDGTDPSTFTKPTISCGWSTPTDIIGGIQAGDLNTTEAVAQCAGFCKIILEPGILDLSGLLGKGVLISLFIQAALTCLFGPSSQILIWLINLSNLPTAIRGIPLIKKLQVSVIETNAVFSVSILIAAVVRHSQNPSVPEMFFLSFLVSMQMMANNGMLYAQLVDDWMGTGDQGLALDGHTLLPSFFTMAASFIVDFPGRTLRVYSQLANECQSQHHFIDFNRHISRAGGKLTLRFCVVTIAIFVGGVISLGIFIAVLTGLCGVTNSMLRRLRKYGVNAVVIFISLFLFPGTILQIIKVDAARKTLKEMSGDPLGEDKWNYAQTAAVLLWAPFVRFAWTESIKHWIVPVGAEAQALDPEVANQQDKEAVPPPYTISKAE